MNADATSDAIVAMSVMIDASYRAGMDPELVLRRRVDKVGVEFGEVADALEKYTGENLRRPGESMTDSEKRYHVLYELLDVATCALGAYEHIIGNTGASVRDLKEHVDLVARRMGAR